MMNFGDQEERSLNIFVFVSLVIHAVLLFTFPQWSGLLETGSPGLGEGGVFQVIYSQSEVTVREMSPVTDPTSQVSSPQVDQPRPTEEPPTEQAAAIPVVPESQENIAPPSQPRPNPVPEVVVPEPVPVRPEPELPRSEPVVNEIDLEANQLITSDAGTEIYVDQPEVDPEPEVIIEPQPVIEIEVEPEPEIEVESEILEESGPSGSGEAEIGGISDGVGSEAESGIGEAEYAPPPPPPLPSARSLIAGAGAIGYPKNAEDEQVEGIVTLDVIVSTAGEIMSVNVIESSGDDRLDRQARLTIENHWSIRGDEQDYVLTLAVEFSLTTGPTVSPVDIRWIED